MEAPEAKFLDIILYSREQIIEEIREQFGKEIASELPAAPWGIISVKVHNSQSELYLICCVKWQYLFFNIARSSPPTTTFIVNARTPPPPPPLPAP